jgi:hypothetical protein
MGTDNNCRFSKRVSYTEASTSDNENCLTSCHPRFVSYLCHFFRVPPVASRTDPDDGMRLFNLRSREKFQ